jgi:hypothetical protein
MTAERNHPDIAAARTVGVGVGLIALMLMWLVGNRLFGAFLDPPAGPVAAFVTAGAAGLVTAVVAGRRLTAAAARDLNRAD